MGSGGSIAVPFEAYLLLSNARFFSAQSWTVDPRCCEKKERKKCFPVLQLGGESKGITIRAAMIRQNCSFLLHRAGKKGRGGRVREVSEREKRKCVRVCMCVRANEIECVCVCVCAGGGFKATCRVHRLAASFDVDAGTAPLPHPPPHTLHFFHISLSRSLYYKVVLRSC